MDREQNIGKSQESRARIQESLKNLFQTATMIDIHQAFEVVVTDIQAQNPNIRPLEMYRMIADVVPPHIPKQKQEEARLALTSIDPKTAQMGKSVFLLFNLEPILTGVKYYLSKDTKDADENDELIQTAIVDLLAKADSLNHNVGTKQAVYQIVQYSAQNFIAQKENMPTIWVVEDKHKQVKTAIDMIYVVKPFGLTGREIYKVAKTLSIDLNVGLKSLYEYILFRNSQLIVPESNIIREGDLTNGIYEGELKEQIQDILEGQDLRAFQLVYFQHLTKIEAGKKMKLSGYQVTQLVSSALKRLHYRLIHQEYN